MEFAYKPHSRIECYRKKRLFVCFLFTLVFCVSNQFGCMYFPVREINNHFGRIININSGEGIVGARIEIISFIGNCLLMQSQAFYNAQPYGDFLRSAHVQSDVHGKFEFDAEGIEFVGGCLLPDAPSCVLECILIQHNDFETFDPCGILLSQEIQTEEEFRKNNREWREWREFAYDHQIELLPSIR